MSADVYRHIARQEAEWTDAERYDFWLDELDRQLTLAEECARDEYEAREQERAE